MFPLLIAATVWLIAVFGVLWHDEPARQPVIEQRPGRKQFPYE
ncbi:MAG TPA: hypothetical protein VNZ25_01390 [Candidatus Angelobacter sp.]|nr:hypothetical protein [Candidatus Angelobacter sp.]